MKILSHIVFAMALIFSVPSYAQIISGGGGGTGGVIPGPTTEDQTRIANLEALKKDISVWLKHFKKDWSDCYTSKLEGKKFETLTSLHTHLTVIAALNPPTLKHHKKRKTGSTETAEECAVANSTDIYSCVFQDKEHNKELNEILSHELLEYFLDGDKESNEKLIYFFKGQLNASGKSN